MDRFLESHKLSQFTQDEVDKMNIPMTNKYIEFIIRNLNEKPSGLDDFTYNMQVNI